MSQLSKPTLLRSKGKKKRRRMKLRQEKNGWIASQRTQLLRMLKLLKTLLLKGDSKLLKKKKSAKRLSRLNRKQEGMINVRLKKIEMPLLEITLSSGPLTCQKNTLMDTFKPKLTRLDSNLLKLNNKKSPPTLSPIQIPMMNENY